MSDLREHLATRDRTLSISIEALWEKSRPLHDRQNRPDSNENGRRHIEMVELNAFRLLSECRDGMGCRPIDTLKPAEIFQLSAAICCHDFDKALESKQPLPPPFQHGDGSGRFAVLNAEVLGLTIHQADAVWTTVRLHDLKAQEYKTEIRKVTRSESTPLGPIDLQRVGIILKAADILQCDHSRISGLATDASKIKDKDRRKYLARNCIKGWFYNGSRVVVQASAKTTDEYDAVRAAFTYMKNEEWDEVAEGLEKCGLPHVLELELPELDVTAKVALGPAGPPTLRVEFEIILDEDFGSFSVEALIALLARIRTIAGTDDVLLKHCNPGSIRLVLAMNQANAECLRDAIARDGLVPYRVKRVDFSPVVKNITSSPNIAPKVAPTILFLNAMPGTMEKLSLDLEIREIQSRVASSGHADALRMVTRHVDSREDLSRALSDEKPEILHFSAHGMSEGVVLFSHGEQEIVGSAELSSTFKALKTLPRVVLLNSCYSGEQARTFLESGARSVIGMSGSVSDSAAASFAASFYRGISAGLSVEHAFAEARAAVRLQTGDEFPVLFTQGI